MLTQKTVGVAAAADGWAEDRWSRWSPAKGGTPRGSGAYASRGRSPKVGFACACACACVDFP